MSVRFRFAALMGVLVAVPAFGQFSNPSFELNDFTSGTSFAGGISRALTNSTPASWTLNAANTGNTDRWVKSSAAKDGNKYIYLSASNPYPNDDCLLGKPCFEAGKTFSFSAWMASASTLAGTNRANFEFREYLSGGGTLETVYSFDLPQNSAWSDSSLTVIPWVQYVQNHTYRPDATGADFWISVQRSASGGTSSAVFDLLDCQIVPAPGASGVLVTAGVLVGRRRRRA